LNAKRLLKMDADVADIASKFLNLHHLQLGPRLNSMA
jgi:hypothetical protein